MLLFKKRFLPAIRSGEKTQTIRLWKFRHMRAGQRSYIPGVGTIRITAVEPVEIDALTDADAIPDGFPTASALQHELRTIYGEKVASGYTAFRILFERVVEEVENRESSGESQNGVTGRQSKFKRRKSK